MLNRYRKVAQAKLGHRAGSSLNHSHAKTEEATSFTHLYQKESLRANIIRAAGQWLIIQYPISTAQSKDAPPCEGHPNTAQLK
jgi:hypothetical protein